MAIITISRGSASGGLLLAEGLAVRLGYDIVRREDIIQEAARCGVPEEKLEKALLEPPGFWDRFSHDRRRYLIFIQEALCERALRDSIVYIGNAGHLLLAGISHVLCIRLIAPLAFRVQMLVDRQGMAPAEAVSYIENVDRQRRDWTRLLYGVDALDPQLYDLTINLKTMTVESAVELAAATALRQEFAASDESRRAMANLAMATRVRAALAADPDTASAEVEVDADAARGAIRLRGKVRPASMVQAVVDVTLRVKGVQELDRENLAALDYTV